MAKLEEELNRNGGWKKEIIIDGVKIFNWLENNFDIILWLLCKFKKNENIINLKLGQKYLAVIKK